MPGREPQVSVCVPTYNRANFLREAIESVLSQSFEDFELIVSDNASEDDTGSVVKSFSDERIRYFRNPQNLGHRENMNRCLMLSRGKYVTILPDDDMMMADNLAAKVGVLAANQEIGLVHSKFHIIDDGGQIIKYNTAWWYGPDRTSDVLEKREDILVRMYNPINIAAAVFRRACYENLGGFSDQVGLAFDYEYWVRIALYYDVVFIAKPLINCRIHADTLTNIHLGIDEEAQKLKGVLAVKRHILRNHSHAIPDDLKRQVGAQAGSSVQAHAETMLGDDGPNPKVRTLLLEMCRTFPGILLNRGVWKVLLKSMMSRRNIDRLKRISRNLKIHMT